jgi:hypothetical protein
MMIAGEYSFNSAAKTPLKEFPVQKRVASIRLGPYIILFFCPEIIRILSQFSSACRRFGADFRRFSADFRRFSADFRRFGADFRRFGAAGKISASAPCPAACRRRTENKP